MRVLVTGAYGLIGAACLARLQSDGHQLVGAGRSISAARRQFAYAQWIEIDVARLTEAAAWQRFLRGIDAVVNCVGVLQDGARDDVRRVQLLGTQALFDACVRTGVKRIVHVSAIGASPEGPSAFSRTKAAAEAHLQRLALDWVILRPALVLGAAAYGGTALLRGIAAFPGIVPVIAADSRIQVLSLDDLAETVAWSLKPGAPSRVVWDVAHPQVHALAALVLAMRGWLGFAPCRVLRLPDGAGRVVAAIADASGWLGWRSPARSTAFAQLSAGVVGDPAAWMAATGVRPKSLNEILAARPASVQDRWFARLYLLKPLAVVGLAAMAIGSGAAQLASRRNGAAATADASMTAFTLHTVAGLVYGVLAILVGLGLLARTTARPALMALVVLALVHVVDGGPGSWSLGHLPLAAISAIPIVLAALLTLAIADER